MTSAAWTWVLALMLVSGTMIAGGQTMEREPVTPNADRIRPWTEDARYWQYRGAPVLLVGGSREDNLFQIPDLQEQLDLLASVGGN